MPRLPISVLRYGAEAPLPEQIALRAGPLTLIYQEGDLRYIRLGDREILRRIYVAVRDHNWGTVLPVLSNVQMAIADDAFTISYDAENRQGAIDFGWRGVISGDAHGTITFAMEGEARTTFLRNRIGFCVLYPIRECAGVRAHIEHVDGRCEEGVFPHYIAPQAIVDGIIQPVHPFSELRAVAHAVAADVWAEVRLAGEIFEMEDQRNWIDASYKIYGTPLRLPFPVEVRQGTRIVQSVTLSLRRAPHTGTSGPISQAAEGERRTQLVAPARSPVWHLAPGAAEKVLPSGMLPPLTFVLHPSSATRPLPAIGLGMASHGQPLSPTALARLKALNLAHLRVDLPLFDTNHETWLRRAAAEAHALGVPLEVALILSDRAEEELRALATALERTHPAICRWLIFHRSERVTREHWVRLVRRYLGPYAPGVPLGGGTNAYFAELNRDRPPISALDLVCYAITPQVHAFDNASLIETLEAQASTVESARQFVGGRPLVITPVTLKPRFNPNATGPEPPLGPGELPPQVDLRQMSLFGAGWTAGSLKYLAASGASSVTYYETTGWRGVMETEAGSPLPEHFRSLPGAVFPLYHVLADVGEFATGRLVPATSSDTLRVDGLALRKGAATRVVLANLSAKEQSVVVHGLHPRVWVRCLDETNAEEAMLAPEAFRAQEGVLQETVDGALKVVLLPYAVARIDSR